MVGNMGRYSDSLLLELTYEEAFDLFTRCLKSSDEDNEESRTVLMKLGRLLDQFRGSGQDHADPSGETNPERRARQIAGRQIVCESSQQGELRGEQGCRHATHPSKRTQG